MSFSSNVKSELSHHFGNERHCNLAEISAIINICGQIYDLKDNFCIKVQTENVSVAKKYFTLMKKTFNIDSEIAVRRNSQLKKNRVYILTVKQNREVIEKILLSTGIIQMENGIKVVKNKIYPLIINSICCKRSYIRGAFLSSGSVSDPEKTYHIEFVNNSYEYSEDLRELINSFNLDSKIVKRKESYIVYLKEGEQIIDLLNIMSAPIALLEFENVRILKEMRNNVNRKVNCETANLEKTIVASVKQVEDINYITNNFGLSILPEQLRETALLRLEYPQESLKEFGKMLNPTVSKSGVNHRLRKISDIAQTLREDAVKGND